MLVKSLFWNSVIVLAVLALPISAAAGILLGIILLH